MEKAKLVVQGLAQTYELEISRDALVSELKQRIRELLEDHFHHMMSTFYLDFSKNVSRCSCFFMISIWFVYDLYNPQQQNALGL